MTHGSMLIRQEGEGTNEVELHTTHDGHIFEAVKTVLGLPFGILEYLIIKKDSKLDLLVDRPDIKKLQSEEERFGNLVRFSCRSNKFEIAPCILASYIVTAHFDRWFPMPVSDDQELLDYWGKGDPDLIVSVEDDSPFELVHVELSPRFLGDLDKEDAESLERKLDELIAKFNAQVAPHAGYHREGLRVSYNFSEVMLSLIAKRYDELSGLVKEWQDFFDKKYHEEQARKGQ